MIRFLRIFISISVLSYAAIAQAPSNDEIIAKAKASGELSKISEKWLKAPLPADI